MLHHRRSCWTPFLVCLCSYLFFSVGCDHAVLAPGARPAAGGEGGHDHDHDHDEPGVIHLSEQARVSLGIEVVPLTRSDYVRYLRVPGQVVVIPGTTELDVSAKASGEVSQIFVKEGQLVAPGSPLFEIRIVHEEAIVGQVELLEALAQLEVVNAEVERLEKLERTSPGSVPGTRLIQQQYERSHLHHKIAARRQMLTLLGIPMADVDGLIERHRQQHHLLRSPPDEEGVDTPLLETITIRAPLRDPADSSAGVASYAVQHLQARVGQHVELHTTLCQLADYRELYVEGSAFDADLAVIRQAMERGWQAEITAEQREFQPVKASQLPILFIAPHVDAQSRTAKFYLALPNELRGSASGGSASDTAFADWKFRPGQRVEVRIPIEVFPQQLVLPNEALVRDGLAHFIFVQDGDDVREQEVALLYRDADVAVLRDDPELEGKSVVTTGAYQIKLALLNRASGPIEHHDH